MKKQTAKPKNQSYGYLQGILVGFLIAVVVFKLLPNLGTNIFNIKQNASSLSPTPTVSQASQVENLTKEVMPAKLNLGISWGDLVKKMASFGVIDETKFLALYKQRGNLSEKEQKLFKESSPEEIVVTPDNAGVILNLLWPLGIANKTKVLSEGPMGTTYKDKVGNFASTGGWDLGKVDGGQLFNKYNLITLNSEQESLVKEVAENIYRPCCGNSTYFPDCNHGAGMLGFIEMAAAAGMSKEEIYKKALVLNSYWFPQTYVELAVYFQSKKGTPWSKVDPKVVLGKNYSSGQGYAAISQELQAGGLIPKVEKGGSCGA